VVPAIRASPFDRHVSAAALTGIEQERGHPGARKVPELARARQLSFGESADSFFQLACAGALAWGPGLCDIR
jgi:hypothetical protein